MRTLNCDLLELGRFFPCADILGRTVWEACHGWMALPLACLAPALLSLTLVPPCQPPFCLTNALGKGSGQRGTWGPSRHTLNMSTKNWETVGLRPLSLNSTAINKVAIFTESTPTIPHLHWLCKVVKHTH